MILKENLILYLTQADECRREGDIPGAIELYRKATKADSASVIAWANLATGLYQLQKTDEAKQACEQGLVCDPGHAILLNMRARIALDENDLPAAHDSIHRAIAAAPHLPDIHLTLGAIHEKSGDIPGALQAYKAAITRNNQHAGAHIALATLLAQTGQAQEAQERFTQAIHLDPTNPTAWYCLGVLLRDAHHLEDAILCFEKTLACNPERIDALVNCAEIWQTLGFLEKSKEYLTLALSLSPDNMQVCSNWLVLCNYLPMLTPEQVTLEHATRAHKALQPKPRASFTKKDPSRRIRIGYVSPDFSLHPAASFLMPLIEAHDRTTFEVICFPTLTRTDEITKRFRAHASEWHSLVKLSTEEATQHIRDLNIDILVDCAGHLEGNRLDIFAQRAAPVQVSFIGYPGTTGCSEIDYCIGDANCDPPENDSLFTEKVIRLPGSFCAYEPLMDLPVIGSPPCTLNNHITFGSLHTLARLNEHVLALWAKVLTAVPKSNLLICRTTLIPRAEKRVEAVMMAHGIAPERISFVNNLSGYQGHLDVYNKIDIALDTFPWSGHTTACEALLMGVPTITIKGDRHAGRMVASVLSTVGYSECIASDQTSFVNIAKFIAAQPQKLIRFREQARNKMLSSALGNGKVYARNVEEAYRHMMQSV